MNYIFLFFLIFLFSCSSSRSQKAQSPSIKRTIVAYEVFETLAGEVLLSQSSPEKLYFATAAGILEGKFEQQVSHAVNDCGDMFERNLYKYKLVEMSGSEAYVGFEDPNFEIIPFDTLKPSSIDSTFIKSQMFSNVDEVKDCTSQKSSEFEEIICPFDSFFRYKGKLLVKNNGYPGEHRLELIMILKIAGERFLLIRQSSNKKQKFLLIPEEGKSNIIVSGSQDLSC